MVGHTPASKADSKALRITYHHPEGSEAIKHIHKHAAHATERAACSPTHPHSRPLRDIGLVQKTIRFACSSVSVRACVRACMRACVDGLVCLRTREGGEMVGRGRGRSGGTSLGVLGTGGRALEFPAIVSKKQLTCSEKEIPLQ